MAAVQDRAGEQRAVRVLIASGNSGKCREIRALLALSWLTWVEPGELPVRWIAPAEDAGSFFGNARQKARSGAAQSGLPCLADDSGLIVPALGGAPGVYSSRYAGERATARDNNRRLLESLAGQEDRRARFECAVVLVDAGGEIVAETTGRVTGRITSGPERGERGFGYDPLFVPDGYSQTFGELGDEVKGRISHRARALAALREALERASAAERLGAIADGRARQG